MVEAQRTTSVDWHALAVCVSMRLPQELNATQTMTNLYRGAGTDGATSRSGRRSFLSSLANKGTAIHRLRTLSGHRSISTTATDWYSSTTQLQAAVALA